MDFSVAAPLTVRVEIIWNEHNAGTGESTFKFEGRFQLFYSGVPAVAVFDFVRVRHFIIIIIILYFRFI